MRKVLICEDEPLLAADLAAIVEEAGHAVCGVFHSAREALNRAPELHPISRSSTSSSLTVTPEGPSRKPCSHWASASLSCRATRTSAPASAACHTHSPVSPSAGKS
jgi:CheY-like chemotaxis protein